MSSVIRLQQLLHQGKETALLRFNLGQAYFQRQCFLEAVNHLSHAVKLSPGNVAAWKLYAHALVKLNRIHEAADAYAMGIAVAYDSGEQKDDKELQNFLSQLRFLN